MTKTLFDINEQAAPFDTYKKSVQAAKIASLENHRGEMIIPGENKLTMPEFSKPAQNLWINCRAASYLRNLERPERRDTTPKTSRLTVEPDLISDKVSSWKQKNEKEVRVICSSSKE